jgi:AraC family transcriptional regulator, transcriptional activator of pobA
MREEDVFTIINRQNGNLAFKLFTFTGSSHFDHLQRYNFYSLIWVKQGSGLLIADFSEYLFQKKSLFSFAPYQPFMFSAGKSISGTAIQFHSDFFCIHRNPGETNCDTVLFNNIYQQPFISIDSENEEKLNNLLVQLTAELHNQENENYELIVPLLKIVLVTASRIKLQEPGNTPVFTGTETPFILKKLKAAIEENYMTMHSAGGYADLLNISPNALAKIVKTHFNKPLTVLITGRIIIEAKRALYMTSKPIKEIARNLGYADEFHFSRVFKNNTDISPQLYRDTVGFGKAEQA